ncbi:THAP domain-containing protein 5-like [Mantella aurantiaca]
MPFCVVKGCPSKGRYHDPNTTLHVFPKDLRLIKRWLEQLPNDGGDIDEYARKVKEGKTNETYRMCSKHFTPDSYYISKAGKNRLLKTALPTIFPEDYKQDDPSSSQIRPYKRRSLLTSTMCPTCGHSLVEPLEKVDIGLQTDHPYPGHESTSSHRKEKTDQTQRGTCIDHMTTSVKMEDQSQMTERILKLILEIIYLLTGESLPPVVSGDHVTITLPTSHSMTFERHNKQEILEVTQKMIGVLTGEVSGGFWEIIIQ